jgi:hypothetical protein
MSAGKVIENIIIFGGIGTIAYMLLKKQLPTKESCEYDEKYIQAQNNKILLAISKKASPAQIKQLQADYDIVKTRYDRSNCGLVAPKKVNPAGAYIIPEPTSPYCTIDSKDMYNVPVRAKYDDCMENYKKNSDVWKPLIDPNTYLGTELNLLPTFWSRGYYQIFEKASQAPPFSCGNIDVGIKNIKQNIQNAYKYAGSNKVDTSSYDKQLAELEENFKKYNCRDKIEAERTKMVTDLQLKGSVNAEKSIVTKAFTEQKTYIILGALVLLTGFYVVVKK